MSPKGRKFPGNANLVTLKMRTNIWLTTWTSKETRIWRRSRIPPKGSDQMTTDRIWHHPLWRGRMPQCDRKRMTAGSPVQSWLSSKAHRRPIQRYLPSLSAPVSQRTTTLPVIHVDKLDLTISEDKWVVRMPWRRLRLKVRIKALVKNSKGRSSTREPLMIRLPSHSIVMQMD